MGLPHNRPGAGFKTGPKKRRDWFFSAISRFRFRFTPLLVRWSCRGLVKYLFITPSVSRLVVLFDFTSFTMAENKASIDIERPASQRTLTPSYTGSAAKKDEESPATKEDVAQPEDPNAVGWDGPDDPNNPMNWPARKKWTCIGALSVMTLLTYVPSPSSSYHR